jgi:hypothetical protein
VVAEKEASRRPKLTVRPTKEDHRRLHEIAGSLGYDSLSAYLIDRGLCDGGVLPRERRTLESLLLHVSQLTEIVEEESDRRRAGVLDPVPPELLSQLTRNAAEALRLIGVLLGRAADERGREAA